MGRTSHTGQKSIGYKMFYWFYWFYIFKPFHTLAVLLRSNKAAFTVFTLGDYKVYVCAYVIV